MEMVRVIRVQCGPAEVALFDDHLSGSVAPLSASFNVPLSLHNTLKRTSTKQRSWFLSTAVTVVQSSTYVLTYVRRKILGKINDMRTNSLIAIDLST